MMASGCQPSCKCLLVGLLFAPCGSLGVLLRLLPRKCGTVKIQNNMFLSMRSVDKERNAESPQSLKRERTETGAKRVVFFEALRLDEQSWRVGRVTPPSSQSQAIVTIDSLRLNLKGSRPLKR